MSGKGSVSAAKLRPIDVSGIRMRERKSRVVTVAATQMAIGPDPDANTEKGERFVRDAAARGAQIILLQELFETPYFCKDQREELFALAIEADVDRSPFLARFAALAKELRVVLPISFFERSGKAFFNSLSRSLLQLDWRRRGTLTLHAFSRAGRRRHIVGCVPQEPHSRWAGIPGKVLFLTRRYWIQGLSDEVRRHRVRDLLGSMAARVCPYHGVDGCGNFVLPHSDRHRATRSNPGLATPLAPGDAGSCCCKFVPRGRI